MSEELTRFLQDSNRFPTQSSYNLSGSFSIANTVPALSSVSSDNIPISVKLYFMFFRLRIRSVPYQGHPFIDFDYFGVKWGRTTDIQIEDPWT
jgi:hypothetical protein